MSTKEIPMDGTTETLATYAFSLSYSDLSPGAVWEAKRRIIDSLGCAMGGYLGEPSKIARALASKVTSTSPSRVWGSGQPTSPEMAAFANTVMVRYLDYNDIYLSVDSGHPSDMIPAVLAIAEPMHASGKDVILATVLAYELFGAFTEVIPLRAKGWDQGIYAAVGSAVATGKLMGLPSERLAHAISMAVIPNAPLRQTRVGELSMWKGCATAAATRNGIFAGLLATEGMTGPYEPFEGRYGVWQQVTGPFKVSLTPPGAAYAIERSCLKFFPAEAHSQAPLWMALELRGRVPTENIASIAVATYGRAHSEIGSEPAKWDPQTRETADHSLPYLLAVALQDGELTPASFTPERITDPGLRPLMRKISVRENPQFTREYPATLTTEFDVTTTAGERLKLQARYPRGHYRNPMTDEEVNSKFERLCRGLLTPKQRETALEALWKLEDIEDIGRVIDRFRV